MRIAIVCHTRHPIRAPFAGGLEAQCWHLAAGLEQRGHEIVLFASGDSDPAFAIDPVHPVHVERVFPGREHLHDPDLQAHVDLGYARACERIGRGRFDMVHNNSLHRFVMRAAQAGRWAAVTSLHTPPLGGLEHVARATVAPWHWFAAVSRVQRAQWWPDGAPAQSVVVPNGIDPGLWPFVAEGDGSAVWSGRLTRDKGPHWAARAARSAGLRLTLLGPIEDRGYLEAEVAPLLGDGVAVGGHLDGRDLAEAVGRASVFVSTPCWDEPFGLAAIEAMACGVPVAAFDRGAVREVVGEAHGRFAAPGDVEGLARCMADAMSIDRATVRERMLAHHTIDAMIDRTLALYETVASARGRALLG